MFEIIRIRSSNILNSWSVCFLSLHLTDITCWLQYLSTATATANLIYIDGTDAAEEGTFVSNATGDMLTYTNWRSGEPNNYQNNEDCVLYRKVHGTWNDISCSTPLQAICESPSKNSIPRRWLVLSVICERRSQFWETSETEMYFVEELYWWSYVVGSVW